MKREDLYRSRGTRPRDVFSSRTSRSKTTAKTTVSPGKILPLCHLLQIGIAIVVLLLVIGGQTFMKTDLSQSFQSKLQQEICKTMELPEGEWSGSLKEILFMEK